MHEHPGVPISQKCSGSWEQGFPVGKDLTFSEHILRPLPGTSQGLLIATIAVYMPAECLHMIREVPCGWEGSL